MLAVMRAARLRGRTSLGVKSGAARHQRELLWTFYRPNRQIDIKIRPIQVICCWPLHVQQFADWRFSKPRKLAERNEQLFIPQP